MVFAVTLQAYKFDIDALTIANALKVSKENSTLGRKKKKVEGSSENK